jgi:hypothetical protein
MVFCAEHPQVAAVWRCRRCERLCCGGCRRALEPRHGVVVSTCRACDGVLEPYRTERVLEGREDLADLVGRPLSSDGVLAAFCCAVPGALGVFGSCLGAAVVYAYYFVIIRHLGDGRDGFPGPAVAGDLDEIKSAGWQGLAIAIASGLPLAAYGVLNRLQWPELEAGSPVALALALAPQIYLPAAIMAVALGRHALNAFWPPAWVRIAAAAPGQYLRLVALFGLCGLWLWAIGMVAAPIVGGIPIVGKLAVGTLSNLVLFIQACLAGGYLRRNSELVP